MAKKIKGKGEMPYSDSGARQPILWTDIPLHTDELLSAEERVNKIPINRNTFTTQAEVHPIPDFSVKKKQKPAHRYERHLKCRTEEQLLIPERSRDFPKTGSSKTKHSGKSHHFETGNMIYAAGMKHRDIEQSSHLRNRYISETQELSYDSGESSYLRSRDIFETGGVKPSNYEQGRRTKSRRHIKVDEKQSEDLRQDHHPINRNLIDRTYELPHTVLNANTGVISKKIKIDKQEDIRQSQHKIHKDVLIERRKEKLLPTDRKSYFEKKDFSEGMRVKPNNLGQGCRDKNRKVTNTKGEELDLKENRNLVSKKIFKIEGDVDESSNPKFDHCKDSEVGRGEIETSFSETLSPISCSDVAPIIEETERIVTRRFECLSRYSECVKERIGKWWRASVCQRNLKEFPFFYVIAVIVCLVCMVMSAKVGVDLMDIPLSVLMVCIFCCTATLSCERGCLLTYLEYRALLHEGIADQDYKYHYRPLCSDCSLCCTAEITTVQPRARIYSYQPETNTAFEHEVADISQISPTECPQIRLVDGSDLENSESPNNLSESSRVVAAVVHQSETGDETKENIYICEHYGQSVACGCASLEQENKSAATDFSRPEIYDDDFNFKQHQEFSMMDKKKKAKASYAVTNNLTSFPKCGSRNVGHGEPTLRKELENASNSHHEVKSCDDTEELDKTRKSKVTDGDLSRARNDDYSLSGHDKDDGCSDLLLKNKSDDDDSLPGYSSDDVSPSINENNRVGECEHAKLREKETQSWQSYSSLTGDDDVFITKDVHERDALANSAPTQQKKTKAQAFPLQASVKKTVPESEDNTQNILNPEQDASQKKKSERDRPTSPYCYISICGDCGKDIMWASFSVDGEERIAQYFHECEGQIKNVAPAVSSQKKHSGYKDTSKPSSSEDDDLFICEHSGQSVACACAEIAQRHIKN